MYLSRKSGLGQRKYPLWKLVPLVPLPYFEESICAIPRKNNMAVYVLLTDEIGAAYRIRTGDFQFGKLTFYR